MIKRLAKIIETRRQSQLVFWRILVSGKDWLWQLSCRLPRFRFFFHSVRPVSDIFGFDQGLPIDRYYTEKFLTRYSDDIRGKVLEVKDNEYTKKFGGMAVISSEILDINSDNVHACIHTNLLETQHMPSERYDCIILTFVLHYIDDLSIAAQSINKMLKPGGVLLCVLPALQRNAEFRTVRGEEFDYWRFTAASANYIFSRYFTPDNIIIKSYGNVYAASCSLYGLSAINMSRSKLDYNDERFPVVVCVRAQKI